MLQTGGLTAQVTWLGLRVGGRLAVFYIHQMNRVNSHNDLVVMMTALKYRPGYYYYYYYDYILHFFQFEMCHVSADKIPVHRRQK